MKKYPKMKPSGVEWMGDVPEHWEVSKVKFVSFNLDGKRIPLSSDERADIKGEFPYYGATGIIDQIDKFIFDGTYLLIGEDGAPFSIPNRDVAFVAKGKFWVNNHAHILQTIEGNDIEFLKHLLNCVDYSGYINGSTREKLTQSQLSNIPVLKVSFKEQTAIAAYLDRKTAQIDQSTAEKERLIELFREERQAIINHAVTKGIRPGVKMKPSGVEWIGDVPEGWEVKKLKYLLKETDGAIRTGPFGSQLKSSELDDNGSYKVYNQRSVLDNDFESGSDFISDEKFEALKAFEIFPNDILITTRGTIGRCTIFPKNVQRGVLHPCLIRVQVDEEKVLKEWVVNYCNGTTYFLDNVLLVSNSTTIDVIYGYTLKEVFFPVPSLHEQSKILAYLNDKTTQIDTAISGIRQEIALLQEYRQALIFEAVTGKIDVRDYA